MNEQQKKAVEEKCTSVYGTDQYFWAQQRDGFRVGAQEVINNPSKYGLQPINDWVSVKDRLPKPYVKVLIFIKYPKGSSIELSYFVSRTECFDNFHTDYITHWQPLPQPPINEREEG